eukprot:5957690-Prorocentrum_lima.AAC.1
MCIRDSQRHATAREGYSSLTATAPSFWHTPLLSYSPSTPIAQHLIGTVSYTHLRAHETRRHL